MAQKVKRKTKGGWGGARSRAGRKIKLEPASAPDETPLEYLGRIMRDGATNPARRDWAAKTVLPFTALKGAAAADKPGKKARAEAAAKNADAGTDWERLLRY